MGRISNPQIRIRKEYGKSIADPCHPYSSHISFGMAARAPNFRRPASIAPVLFNQINSEFKGENHYLREIFVSSREMRTFLKIYAKKISSVMYGDRHGWPLVFR